MLDRVCAIAGGRWVRQWPWRTVATWAVLAAAAPVSAATYRAFAGSVTYVADGDTVHVLPLRGGVPVKVRIHGIDAPEICQPGGTVARDAMVQRVQGRKVVVYVRAHDKFGRAVARVTQGGEDIGQMLVRQGLAWAYDYRTGAGPYAAWQRHAQASGVGVFAMGNPVEPSLFRRRHGSCH